MLVGGLVACASDGGSDASRAAGPLAGRRIVVVGDSVTARSAATVTHALDGADVQIIAHEGFPSTALLPLLRRQVGPGRQRDLVALLVGYNDVRLRDVDPPSLPALIREAARFRCAVWLTLPARPGGADDPNDAVPSRLVDQWNERAVAEVAKHPTVHVATDWQDAVEGAADPRTFLDPDGVHPNEAGRQRLARAYAEALARHC